MSGCKNNTGAEAKGRGAGNGAESGSHRNRFEQGAESFIDFENLNLTYHLIVSVLFIYVHIYVMM